MNDLLVTIITPVYNQAKYLGATLDSFRFQSYPAIQFIVLNDGSTDSTEEVIKAYRPIFYNFEVVSHANMGEQLTVNKGLRMVEGKYFMVVNADDPLYADSVGALVDFMESNPDVLCGYPDWDCIDENGRFVFHTDSREYDYPFMVRRHFCIPSVGTIFRREVIDKVGGRNPRFKWVGDYEYWLRIGLTGNMKHIPSTLAKWRYHKGQLSNNNSKDRAEEHIRLMDYYYSLHGLPRDICELKSEAYCWANLVAAFISRGLRPVFRYTRRAIRYYPPVVRDLGLYYGLIKSTYHYLRR